MTPKLSPSTHPDRAPDSMQVKEATFELNDVFAVDIVMSSGEGKPKQVAGSPPAPRTPRLLPFSFSVIPLIRTRTFTLTCTYTQINPTSVLLNPAAGISMASSNRF